MLTELSVAQYQDLLAYLIHSHWHLMESWRDNALGYLSWVQTAKIDSKAKLDAFLPPTSGKKKPSKKQTPEEMALILRMSLNQQPKDKAHRLNKPVPKRGK
jgi:hypothetical protein